MSGSVFTYEPQMMVTEHINKSCKNVGRRETIPLLEYFYPTSSCITFLSCFPSVDPASGERNWRVLHKNPSSGKRSTEPFGKMDSSGKCVGREIVKVDTVPRREVSFQNLCCIKESLFPEDVN